MAIENIAERALAYSIPAETVDGNDVIEVFLAVKRACERARGGNGPSFIECKTMRMHGHSEHDAAKYVPRELLEDWNKKDPVIKMENYLLSNNVASQKDFSEIDAGIMKETTYLDAIHDALDEEMAHNKDVFLMGEDIGYYGWAFRVTEGLYDKYGRWRVIDTPLS